MIFPQYQYNDYYSGNEEIHFTGWNNMVNGAIDYCKEFNKFKWDEFCYYHFKGKFNLVDLPAFHPYWDAVSVWRLREELEKLIDKYEECKRDPDKLRYYFNQDILLTHVEEMIRDKKEKFNKVYEL